MQLQRWNQQVRAREGDRRFVGMSPPESQQAVRAGYEKAASLVFLTLTWRTIRSVPKERRRNRGLAELMLTPL